MSTDKEPDFRWLCDGSKRIRLKDIRDLIKDILEIALFPHYTDHSVGHSDRLIGIADKLIEPIQETAKKITQEELFILYAACYLHDIGMCFEKVGDTQTFKDLKNQQEWTDLSDESRQEFHRENHNKISAELVRRSLPQFDRPINIQLNIDDKPEYIASLCEAHCLPVEEERYKTLIKEYPNIRLPLLSGLLRLADILDESRRRANSAKAKVLDLGITAQTHWWRHYYTDDIEIELGIIRINFDFPKECEKEYGEVIPQLQVPWIQNEIFKHLAAFSKVGLSWAVEKKILDKPYSSVEKMPELVFSEMIKRLHHQKDSEDKKRKQLVIQSFQQARPYINRRISELHSNKNKLPQQEYLRNLVEISKYLYEIGAKRAAWMLSQEDFCKLSTLLKHDEQLEMGLWLMRIMQEDGHSQDALLVLGKIAGLVTDLPNIDERKEVFFKLQTKILIDVTDFVGAIESIKNAVKLFKQGELVEELQTQHSELLLLQGALNSALELIKDGSIIERKKPFIRRLLVKCRLRAMKGEVDHALKELEAVLISTEIELDPLDKLSILELHAEILYLDGCGKEFFELFENKIQPLLNSIPQIHQNIKMIAEDNYYDSAIDQFEEESLQNYYQLYDLRKLSGLQLQDSDALISAHEHAEGGRHYEAFPIYWRQFFRSYELGSWRAFRWSSNHLAKECLKLDFLKMAAFYSIIAMNQKIAEEVGRRLLELGDRNLIEDTVGSVINYSHLSKYSEVAYKIIEVISDAIPNNQVESVFQWLYQGCKQTPRNLTKTGNYINACTALQSLAFRLNSEQTQKLVQLIVNHEIWKSKSHLREHLFKILNNCIERLSLKELSLVAKELLSLATSRKLDLDYPNVINLLGYIAERVDSSVKNEIAKTLYPLETPEINVSLAKAAGKFGRRVSLTTDLKKVVEEIAKDIRLQVQYLDKEEEPKPVLEMYFSVNSVIDDKKTVVIAAGTDHLKVLIAQSEFFEPEMVKLLSDAILEMISEEENMIGNKIALIDCLKKLSPKFSEEIGNRVFEVFEPIILGRTGGGILGKMSEEAANPMNRFIFKEDSPAQLVGFALYALAYMESCNPGVFSKKLNPLIENALLHVDSEVRKYAFAASTVIPELSDRALIGVLFGTKDSDMEAAIWAFDSILSKKNQYLPDYHLLQLYHSIVMAAKSPHAKLRRMAAVVIKSFSDRLPYVVPEIKEIEKQLSDDVCFSVRSVFS